MFFTQTRCNECNTTRVFRTLPAGEIRCANPECQCTQHTHDPVPELAVALSGGGHRASLFGLGVLLALVDLGLNRQVSHIASVSGGSITNAFVGLNCRFERETPQSFDKTAHRLIDVIVNKGILNTPTIIAIPLVLLIAVVAAFKNLELLPEHLRGAAAFGAVFLALTLFLLRGHLIERLLAKRVLSNAKGKAARFQDFNTPDVEHIICSTEMASGRPVYFSTHEQGRVLIRLAEDEYTSTHGFRHHVRACTQLRVAAAVRSSAAFPPGIPPRRFSRRHFPEISGHPTAQINWPWLVADGGIWSNLATQALLEDEVLKGTAGARFKPEIIFAANASAAFKSVRTWPFHIPGLAELRTVLQAIWIQNHNTVEPRLAHLRERLRYRLKYGIPLDSADPLTAPIDIAKPANRNLSDFIHASSDTELHPFRSAAYREWAEILVTKIEDWQQAADKSSPQDDCKTLTGIVKGEFIHRPDTTPMSLKTLQTLVAGYTNLESDLGTCDLHQLPTSLKRFSRPHAMQLLARGYANTHIMAYGLGLTDCTIILDKQRLETLTAPRQR